MPELSRIKERGEAENGQQKTSAGADSIDALRARIAFLEHKMAGLQSGKDGEGRREKRLRVEGGLEFVGDFDIVGARLVDLSDHGVCFEIGGDLYFDMRYAGDGDKIERSGKLVWFKALGQGKGRLGLEFIPGEERGEF